MNIFNRIQNKKELIQHPVLSKSQEKTGRNTTMQHEEFSDRINNIYENKGSKLEQDKKRFQRTNGKEYESPKLPQKTENDKQYTLVLDIDETLLHTEFIGEEMKVEVRPFAMEFLQKMSILFEIVTFTAASKTYADEVIDTYLDPEQKYISHRLYKNNCKWFKEDGEQFTVKDISKIGRDLSFTMIIDNIADNFCLLQPFNGICVENFEGAYDTVLKNLIPQLTYMVNKCIDVRSFVYSHIQGNKLKNLVEMQRYYMMNKYTHNSKFNNKQKLQQQPHQGILKKRKLKPTNNESEILEDIIKKFLYVFLFIFTRIVYYGLLSYNQIHKIVGGLVFLCENGQQSEQESQQVKEKESSKWQKRWNIEGLKSESKMLLSKFKNLFYN